MKTHKFKSKSPFILASSSPRRIQLLKTILKDFEVIPSSAEEIQPGTFKPENLVIKNADIKCIGIAKKYPNCWVLGSDTLVALEDLVLGKPNDFEDAVKTLSKLSGKTNQVFTGISLRNQSLGIKRILAIESLVYFKRITMSEIYQYFDLVNPLDKAGSYAIQEHPTRIIEKYEGSLNNIIGLPTEQLADLFLEYSDFSKE